MVLAAGPPPLLNNGLSVSTAEMWAWEGDLILGKAERVGVKRVGGVNQHIDEFKYSHYNDCT